MNDWQWFEDFEAAALASGDRERVRLRTIHREACGFGETDPDRALLLLEEGRGLALALKEPWWVLLFDQWLVHITLYDKSDYRHVLEPAVRNLLEVRKPAYVGFPQKLWILGDLIDIYVNLDPLSYADEIEHAIAEVNAELPPETDNARDLLLLHQLDAAFNQARFDDAQKIALQICAEAQADPIPATGDHYLIPTYRSLCYFFSRRHDWAEVATWAEAGKDLARELDQKQPVCVFLMWQAIIAQRQGAKDEAARFYRSALAGMDHLKAPPVRDYVDAMCDYHELCGNLEKSLELRGQAVEDLVSRGKVYDEFEARLAKLRLLKLLKHDLESDLSEARAMTRNFRRPECYLPKIEQIIRG